MNIPNIKKLIAALRSGLYNQTRGRLSKIEYGDVMDCCLGVACKTYIANGNNLKVETVVSVEDDEVSIVSYDNHDRFLPVAVRKWLGFDENNYELMGATESELVSLNDGCKSFEEIADFLQQLVDLEANNGT